MAPLVVIVGPTASGKTTAAIELAEKCNGEIICADSRTVYVGMDIGTAKPTVQEQARVPHWGIDLVRPNEPFSAALFKEYAVQKIAEIRNRGKVPFLVGGTGLYIDSVVLDYQFGPAPDPLLRQKLEKYTIEALQRHCIDNNIALPENVQNKRHLTLAIERNGHALISRSKPIDNTIIVGITTDPDVLRNRIQQRSNELFSRGMVHEADVLATTYGWESEAMTGNIYRLVHQYRLGSISEEELVRQNQLADWHLAKRQMTWFKRRAFIQWVPREEAVSYLSKQLVTRFNM